jgi:lipoprotein-anchoring transpeptidase ErfK/SrfK
VVSRALVLWVLGVLPIAWTIGCRRDPAPSAAAIGPVGSATVESASAPGAANGSGDRDPDGNTGRKSRAKEGADPPSDLPDLPAAAGQPVVGLDGSSRPWPPPLPDGVPRLAALAIETPVLARPDVSAPLLGLLRAGAVVEMDPTPITGHGCQAGFRAVKPLGFVCLGSTTLDLEDPIVRASYRRPDVTQKLPYMYGMATRGGPAYAHVPTMNELRELEPHLPSHIRRWRKDDVNGASYGVELWGKWKREPLPPALFAFDEHVSDPDEALPWFLRGGARAPNLSGLIASDGSAKAGEFSRHNGIAFIDTLLSHGRRYNVAVDLRLMPADRFRPIRGSDFHGFRIPQDVAPPFAIVKRKKAKRLVDSGGAHGHLTTDGPLAWRTAVPITGKQRVQKGRWYTELADGGWVANDQIVRVDVARKMPGWANAGEKWLDVSIARQLLVAYEGTKPVYATLVSTGEAGLDDPKTTKSTARGIFRIHTKHITATMDSKVVGEEFELRDVPYVQYFHEGYALHAAYWHDVFGQPKSHGCINLAPEDARRLFFWTEPQVPPGWHAASKARTGTIVFIHP